MKMRRLSIAVFVFLFLISALQVYAAQGFDGKWNSKLGTIEIAVNGNKVTGSYTRNKGKITGTLIDNGKTLTGKWSEAPSYKPPNNAGKFEVNLSDDGNSFKGKWGYGNASKYVELTASRYVEPHVPITFEGKWQTQWGVMVISISGDNVNATYEENSGKIIGSLSSDGMAIVGTWSKAPSYDFPDDKGNILIRLVSDGTSIFAKWGNGSNLDAGSWTGKR